MGKFIFGDVNNLTVKRRGVFSPSESENAIFEGDNLDSLQLLNSSRRNSFDCIYIDPPYNTGSRNFVYRDSFNRERGAWNQFMRPRLAVAAKLLKEDGVIFVSIDDRELCNLTLLLNEVFGECNKIATFVKTIAGGKNDSKFVKTQHEYLLVYGKSKDSIKILRSKPYIKDNSSPQQLNKWGDNDRKSDRPNLFFPIYYDDRTNRISTLPGTGMKKILPIKQDGTEGCWRWCREKVENEKEKLFIKVRSNGKLGVYVKPSASSPSVAPWSSVISQFPVGGGDEIKAIFGDAKVFNYAKNTAYIKWILALVSNKNARVLDFFAGSGTTGHAVLDLNKEDGGNRTFVLCGNSESTASQPDKNVCRHVCAKRIEYALKQHNLKTGCLYFTVERKKESQAAIADHEQAELLNVA